MTRSRQGRIVFHMTAATETDRIFVPCTRCSGEGRIRAFSHVAAGQCFGCLGTGGQWSTQRDEDRKAKARARAAKKRAAAEEARVAAFVTRYMSEAIAAGVTAQQVHDDRCACGSFCWTTYNGGRQAARWIELGGSL